MSSNIFLCLLFFPYLLTGCASPKGRCAHHATDILLGDNGCMTRSAEDHTLDILQAAINMQSPELFENMLSPRQVLLTDSQTKYLRDMLSNTPDSAKFIQLLEQKLSAQSANS